MTCTRSAMLGLALTLGMTGASRADAPAMQLSEEMVAQQTTTGSGESVVIPMLILALLVLLAGKGGGAPVDT